MFLTRHSGFFITGGTKCFRAVTTSVARSRHVHFEVTPNLSRMDDPVTIQVDDLAPKQPVTMAATLEEAGDVFVSHAHYFADDNGRLDLNTSKSMSGTFAGVESMGLFWSLQPELGSRPGIRLRKKDVTQSHSITLSIIAGHVDANHSSHHKSDILAQTEVKRCYMWEDVLRVPVRHGRIRGTLFIPQNGQGQHPALLDMYGSTGGLAEYRAAMLASRGFTTLALAHMGYQDLPQSLDINFEYFLEAIDFLAGHDNVGSSKLGIIGTSMGASNALNIAPLDTRIRAMVLVGAIGHRIMAPCVYKGKQLSFNEVNWDDLKEIDGAISWQDMMYNAQSPDCVIPVDEVRHTDILFLHGTSDMNTDPRLMLNVASRLLDHGHTGISVHMYQGAGHLIEPPYIPFCYASWHKLCGASAIWGGECQRHAYAQVDAWEKSLRFFKDRILMDGNN